MGKRLLVLLSVALVALSCRAEEYKDPEVNQRMAARLQRVYELAEKDQQAALEELQKDYDPEDSAAVIDYAIGSLYFGNGEYKQALEYYERALDKMPYFRRAVRDAGRVCLADGQTERTVEIYRGIVQAGQADADILSILGFAHLMNGDYVSAQAAFEQALLLEPDKSDALKGLGQSLLNLGKYDEAYMLYDRLSRMDSFQQELWTIKARSAVAAGKLDQAVTDLETVRRLGMDEEEVLLLLGDLYLQRSMPQLALGVYQQVGAVTNLPLDRMVRVARIMIGMQDIEQADEILAQLEKQNVEDQVSAGDVMLLRGDILFAENDLEGAAEQYRSYVELNPLDGAAMLKLGDVLKAQGQDEAALIQYERVQRIAGHEADALVRQAIVLVEREEYVRAVELLERAQSYRDQLYVASYLRQLKKLAE